MAGRQLAGSLFNDDPEYCRARNEESKSTDFGNLARSIAQGWGNPFADFHGKTAES